MSRSDGSTAEYYVLPEGATQLQDLISHRNLNAQLGEIFRACYRFGLADHSDQLRDAKKIRFYAQAEVERLEKLEAVPFDPESMPIIELKARTSNGWQGFTDPPEWATWLALDEEGAFWFSTEPKLNESRSGWAMPLDGKCDCIDETEYPLSKHERPAN